MNEQNLRPFTSDQSREEAAKNGRKGGINSGKKRRQMRLMRECAEILMSKEYTNAQGQKMDGTMIAMTKQFQKMLDGDIKALEFFRDITGQKPVERVEQVNIDADYEQNVEYVRRLMEADE